MMLRPKSDISKTRRSIMNQWICFQVSKRMIVLTHMTRSREPKTSLCLLALCIFVFRLLCMKMNVSVVQEILPDIQVTLLENLVWKRKKKQEEELLNSQSLLLNEIENFSIYAHFACISGTIKLKQIRKIRFTS